MPAEMTADYHERIVSLCLDAGFTPEIRYELRHWLSVVALVAQGGSARFGPLRAWPLRRCMG